MSDFIDFAQSMGLIIRKLRPADRIQRCGTVEKPRSTDGAYFWDGVNGWVWHWARDASANWWKTDPPEGTNRAVIHLSTKHKRGLNQLAAMKARSMIEKASFGPHPYLSHKGFPGAKGFVGEDGTLLIPMRDRSNTLVGLQSIKWDGVMWSKKMLHGMKAGGAIFQMGRGDRILCEGYATGLSIDAALNSIGQQGCVTICFSAGNLTKIGQWANRKAIVFADNDRSMTGELAAKATGLRYCISDVVGEDANDLHQRAGLLAVVEKILEAQSQPT